MITVKTKKELQALRNHKDGEIGIVEETNRVYKWSDATEDWEVMHTQGEGLKTNLYEINQSIISQLPTLTPAQLDDAEILIANYISSYKATYYMLLSNELHYYTIFRRILNDNTLDLDSLPAEVLNCLPGEIKSVELNDNAVELWSVVDGVAQVFYLFNYDMGVIECK